MRRKKRSFVLVEVILAISIVTSVLFYLIQQLRDEYLQKIEALCMPELEVIAHNRLAEIVIQMMENNPITWEKLMAKEPQLVFSKNISIPLGSKLKMAFIEKIDLRPVFKTIDEKNCISISMTYTSSVNKKTHSFNYLQFVERVRKPSDPKKKSEEK